MFVRIAITLAATLGVASAATAAEYVVLQGDTLVTIAEKTSHTVEQLVIMNAGHDWAVDGLPVGTELTYVSRQDLRDANRWCRQRLRELPESDPNAAIFAGCVSDTRPQQLHIRYALNEPSGTHFNSVLAFANAYRERPAGLGRVSVPWMTGGIVVRPVEDVSTELVGGSQVIINVTPEQ